MTPGGTLETRELQLLGNLETGEFFAFSKCATPRYFASGFLYIYWLRVLVKVYQKVFSCSIFKMLA